MATRTVPMSCSMIPENDTKYSEIKIIGYSNTQNENEKSFKASFDKYVNSFKNVFMNLEVLSLCMQGTHHLSLAVHCINEHSLSSILQGCLPHEVSDSFLVRS